MKSYTEGKCKQKHINKIWTGSFFQKSLFGGAGFLTSEEWKAILVKFGFVDVQATVCPIR